MTTAVHDRFATEPLAGDSAQFPLSRGSNTSTFGETEPPLVRPWNLRGMTEVNFGEGSRAVGSYDPVQQVSVDSDGRPVTITLPRMDVTSYSNNDGEGNAEDWKSDFAPDTPVGL